MTNKRNFFKLFLKIFRVLQISKQEICDAHSHGNMQQLDECNFISDETLKEIATDTLDIIEFFDNMHKENIEELIKPNSGKRNGVKC